jgi:hypothetical protein
VGRAQRGQVYLGGRAQRAHFVGSTLVGLGGVMMAAAGGAGAAGLELEALGGSDATVDGPAVAFAAPKRGPASSEGVTKEGRAGRGNLALILRSEFRTTPGLDAADLVFVGASDSIFGRYSSDEDGLCTNFGVDKKQVDIQGGGGREGFA